MNGTTPRARKSACSRAHILSLLMLAIASMPSAASAQRADLHGPVPIAASAAAPADEIVAQHGGMRAPGLVKFAKAMLGVPYRSGGESERWGFDCSGFTRRVFEGALGLVLPRRAKDQASTPDLQQVRRYDLAPGDLVFFNTRQQEFSHVGIYLGDDMFIHSPRTGAVVRIDDMTKTYWAQRFTGARRATSNLGDQSTTK